MPLPLLVFVGLWAVAGGVAGGAIGYAIGVILDEILDWFSENTEIDSSYGELIKEKLASGDYRIVAGVFNKHDVQTASETWDVEELDPELKQYMGRRNRIRVEL